LVVKTPTCKFCYLIIRSFNYLFQMMVADITPDIEQWLLMDENV
jgi:hypothetical protein